MKEKNWFAVSTEGLKTLQTGKPKHYIVRELISNAFDENITYCEVGLSYEGKRAQIKVLDDSPEGFRDLTDAYTLFKETYKRPNPEKRGRFNIGEKQAIALSESARITTTKGTIIFDKEGRHSSREKRSFGSEVILWVKMKRNEFDEIFRILERYIPSKEIKFVINGNTYHNRMPEKIVKTSLKTEIEENGMMKQVQRKTEIWIYRKAYDTAYLYELGIPVCETDCPYDISIQQRIPLSIDREVVSEKYLGDIFAEMLNETYQEIEKESSSDIWVRKAMSNKRIKPEAVKEIVKKRFGEKTCVANPFDPNSVDEAISRGFNVVYGSELSKEEWENVKTSGALASSTELFGKSFVGATEIEPTENMLRISNLARRIAKRILGIEISISFVKSKATCGADYGNRCLTFNVKKLPKSFWENPIKAETLDLLIHELAHERGNHTEMAYHQSLTKIASQLVIIALNEPNFFELV